MEKKKRESYDLKYNPYSFRLHEKTLERLKEMKGNASWNKFFKSIIDREYGNKCHFCGSHNNLERHHIIAVKDGGTDDEDNIMLLCPPCHKKTENWGNKKSKKDGN